MEVSSNASAWSNLPKIAIWALGKSQGDCMLVRMKRCDTHLDLFTEADWVPGFISVEQWMDSEVEMLIFQIKSQKMCEAPKWNEVISI